jgi:hypothetical protein
MSPRTELIAKLNDELRATFLTGKVVLTEGIASLDDPLRVAVVMQVHNFTEFPEDNAPHGERDFGAFETEGVGRVFWKIDYYNRTLDGGSEDPADRTKTQRVLTIMLASEY